MNSRLLSSTELPDIDFYLASGSPRRRELLAQAGYRFAVEVSNVDETADIPEADVLVVALAERKAAAVAERVEGLVLDHLLNRRSDDH